jgi:hypothetical protein
MQQLVVAEWGDFKADTIFHSKDADVPAVSGGSLADAAFGFWPMASDG